MYEIMFHHVINYQLVSIPFAIIGLSVIGVDLQEDKEYNNLRHGISETLKVIIKDLYNKFIKKI
jgi:hypothetical protein